MAKYFGKIGYMETVETEPGIHETRITERNYYGDVTRNSRSLQNQGEVNDSPNISNQISIVADPFAYKNFHSMLYAEYMETKWKVTNVEVQAPRLILTLGGVYNGIQTRASD